MKGRKSDFATGARSPDQREELDRTASKSTTSDTLARILAEEQGDNGLLLSRAELPALFACGPFLILIVQVLECLGEPVIRVAADDLDGWFKTIPHERNRVRPEKLLPLLRAETLAEHRDSVPSADEQTNCSVVFRVLVRPGQRFGTLSPRQLKRLAILGARAKFGYLHGDLQEFKVIHLRALLYVR
jgi:hypothetical protein